MSASAKYLRPGDRVTTKFSGSITRHEITARSTLQLSGSGVTFKVSPPVPKSGGGNAWIDSGWFAAEPK